MLVHAYDMIIEENMFHVKIPSEITIMGDNWIFVYILVQYGYGKLHLGEFPNMEVFITLATEAVLKPPPNHVEVMASISVFLVFIFKS